MEIYTKKGLLTGYGLACGYVEKKKNLNQWKELYVEHNTIHVRSGKNGGIWESFNTNELTKARKFYNQIKLF